MKNKKSIIMIVILLLLVVVSGTMAWLSYQSKKTALVLVLGEDDSFVITIDPYHYKGTLPSSVNYSQLSTYSSVSANNSSTASSNKFKFFYRVNEIDEELLSGSLKYAITRSTTLNGTYTEVASGTFNSSNTVNDFYVFKDTVPAGTTYYYKGYIYIDGSTDNTNLVDKTVNMEFRASFGFTGAEMLISKANAANVTTYSAGNTGEMYTFSQPATDQAEATTDYRYIGNSPNNYIEFNNETWRIIGVFDDRIKIIKDTPLTSLYWDYKKNGVGSSKDNGSNDWVDSQLMYMLNPDDIARNVALKTGYTYDGSIVKDASKHIIYQKGCTPAAVSTTTTSYSCTTSPWSLNAEALSQIDDATYYLGGSSSPSGHNAVSYYTFERGSTRYNTTRSLNWTGKVGLMYPSDYAYTFAYGVDDTCYNDGYNCNTSNPSSSWLHKESTRWTIASASGRANYVFHVYSNGRVRSDLATFADGVAPVVYLKSDIVLEGNGTNDTNIYKIVN